VGVIVPRFGHTAVARNALKRRLREIVRIELLPVMPAVDAVIRVLPSAYRVSFDALRIAVQYAGGRLPRAAEDDAS
jgi:ribonuclease P protein component